MASLAEILEFLLLAHSPVAFFKVELVLVFGRCNTWSLTMVGVPSGPFGPRTVPASKTQNAAIASVRELMLIDSATRYDLVRPSEKYRPSLTSPLANSVTVERERPRASGEVLWYARRGRQCRRRDMPRRNPGPLCLIRSSVATVVVVAGTVVGGIVVLGVVVLGADELVAGVVSATLVVADTGEVGGAEASLLLHPATTSAAQPKATSRFVVCTRASDPPNGTLPP